MENNCSIFWFRRDLRLDDNAALFYALKKEQNVLPLFIFDSEILNKLENKNDSRVVFIYNQIESLFQQLVELNSSIIVKFGNPKEVFLQILNEYNVYSVYTNHDYEPYAFSRDETIKSLLSSRNIPFYTYKDQVVFEKDEILKDDGKPYTVFTPYSKKWKSKLSEFYYKSYDTQKYFRNLFKSKSLPLLSISDIGFEKSEVCFPSSDINIETIKQYSKNRDFPSLDATTRLSLHLRFGTVSIRKLVKLSLSTSESWLNELIWRDFYMMILFYFPHVVNNSFKSQYDKIPWRNNEQEFKAWCNGLTGYPIVDAGMRQLNTTGFMHNRVRMIVASFLTKHLLIDWRWGEAYFASKLLDFDLAANNGGWQWAAGSGCDAAPYFRIFNPTEQVKKFDPELKYIKKWVPEFDSLSYPRPIVDHKFARERALSVYKNALQ